MENHSIIPKPQPTGTRTIRLADIPEPVRRRAALQLMRDTDNTAEFAQLFELVYDPGNKGGRIAA